ncbi:MAG: DUF1285 domain-containing protein [Paracoccus sp. (in: a-proteobacteria)]|uniref:DUF1285 domain-containing protein n=1 Tax=Paracoccus sp. TaxID=267 RepID=UPI0026E09063|nr:DUF1285 domain-containing protein [Paracoccus sp. (in: a-proteobacteria)]MDO5620420.1 DUF1285 domain-containing protein [Paracoccus sp. (in: a-proteobacteria)]
MPDKDHKPADDPTARLAAAGKGSRPAPVHLWNPPYCGKMDLTIRADGSWWHEGTLITRPALVQLFANILKYEDNRFYLVTPVEKLGITVQDAPFLATDLDDTPEGLRFQINYAPPVIAGPENPLRVDFAPDGTPRPYVLVRPDLWALIDRKTFYRLATRATSGPDGRAGVTSQNVFFPLEGQP